MATKNTSKQPVEPITENKTAFSENVDAALRIAPDIEDMIADQLLDSVNWQQVKQILVQRARQKFWVWLSSQLLPIDGTPVITNEIEAMAIAGGENSDA